MPLQSTTTAVKTALPIAFCLLASVASAQRLTIVIDPARGGKEYGARIDEHTYEKQVTLDLANRLKSLLNARDFDVVLTRDSDVVVTSDQRATAANQAKPIACLLLHSTGSGTGLHLFTSSLPPASPASTAVLWDQAQAPFVSRSERLANELSTALSRSKVPVSTGRTWVRPLDNMQCPAIALEIAPENSDTPASDHTYQTRIADAIASSMLFWRGHEDVVQSVLNPPRESAPTPQPETKQPAAKPASADASSAATTPAASKPKPPKPAVPKPAPASPPEDGSLPQ